MDPMLVEVENPYCRRLLSVQVACMDPELFEAVTSGNINALELLITRGGADILGEITPMKDTCIHIAARHGHSEVITRVHTRCPDLVSKANTVGDTPLHIAARNGHLGTLSCLINCAMSIEVEAVGRREQLLHGFIRNVNQEKNTVMHEAVKYGHLKIVDFLAKKDPQLLCMDNYAGESPLYVAVEIVEEILSKDRYSHNGPNSGTALHAAIIHKKSAVAELLLDKKPELIIEEDVNRRTALHYASALGLLEFVRILLKYGTSPCYILDKSGSAPIHLSARSGRVNVIREFLHQRPDLKDFVDGKFRNILHIAVESLQVKVVKYILKEKTLEGLINGMDEDGNTPLHQAALNSNPYVVNILVRDKRVDTTILSRKRLTALDIARSLSHQSVEDRKELVLATLLYFTASPYPKSVWMETLLCGVNQRLMSIEWYKEKANTLLVVATLVATVTFAAGFTVPGRYQSDGVREGMPTLVRLAKFKQFIWWDSLAMNLSTVAVVILIWVQFVRHLPATFLLCHLAQVLNILALQCMSLAFVSGLNLTLDEDRSLNRNISTLGYAFCIIIFAKFIEYLKPVMYIFPHFVYFRSWANHIYANVFRPLDANQLTMVGKNDNSLLLLHY